MKSTLLEDTALCFSFSGSSTGDSPLELAREMLREGVVREVVWGVTDMSLDVDPGMRKVPVDSEEFITLLHQAKWLVNSAHFPHYFRKRIDQVYVQTWHGTPLKKIANDVPQTSLSDSYRDLMAREVGYWDYLLAQSPQAGSILAKAFGYSGPVISVGYPRNDALHDAERMNIMRQNFREKIGITKNHTVVLYAPTWRDNAVSGIGAESFESLDYGSVLSALGPESVLLVRGHSNTLSFGRRVDGAQILDVSGFNDLVTLFAASDLLITDYSSLFFDYLHTGKPIVGFVPDLEEYSESVRGLYFDYEDVFPGIIASSNSELIPALHRCDVSRNRGGDFIEEILHTETAGSARRVLQAILIGETTT